MDTIPTFRDSDHLNPKDCQLLLAITGDKKRIKEVLERCLLDLDGSYGKPMQGITVQSNCTYEIITPVWEGGIY